jgi:hypothetical protein
MHLVPDMKLFDQQAKFSAKSFLWTQTDIVQVSLLKMLQDVNAPLYLFDKILKWAAEANSMSYKFPSVFRHRKKLMSDLYDRLDMHGLKPQRKKYKTHDGSEDEVVTFDFKQSLLSLLRDKFLMSDDNMLFSGDTPF